MYILYEHHLVGEFSPSLQNIRLIFILILVLKPIRFQKEFWSLSNLLKLNLIWLFMLLSHTLKRVCFSWKFDSFFSCQLLVFYEFLSPRLKTLNPRYIILISFNCTCIFYHIQLTRACPSPLAVIWYLCIGFVYKVNKTENLNSTDSQPGQQWTVFQIVTHTKLGGFKPLILYSRGASILQIRIAKFFYHSVLSKILVIFTSWLGKFEKLRVL